MSTPSEQDKTVNMTLRKAFDHGFHLGQTYWQQADHHFISQQNKADATAQRFREFADSICAKYESDLAAAVARAEAAEADARRYRKALIEIRDSTYRNAVTLRGIANNAIDAMQEPKNGS